MPKVDLNTLNKRKIEILQCIQEYRERNKISPSVRDIADSLEMKSTSGVQGYLDDLERYGYINRIPGVSRSVYVTDLGLHVIERLSRVSV